MLWGAVGLDLIISTVGFPMLGQAVSAILVLFYLLDHVSVRRVVCSFWFAIIDLFFREISVGGDSKLEPLKDGRAVIFVSPPHPGVELRADLKSIPHRCHLFEVAFAWELSKEFIHLPVGCHQGGGFEPAVEYS